MVTDTPHVYVRYYTGQYHDDAWAWDWDDMPVSSKAEDGISTNEVCNHEWVNVSFHHIHMACKFCGIDKPG
jgi:hypothetical protein